jgi:1-acyl-sn-glycerol-3-phosphate acyltransferase
MRDRIDRFLSALARLVLRGFYRDVETEGWDELPRGRPFLVVANHFNGFVDPALLVALAGRTPRFLAKASLWKVMAARPFLALAGILPVARPEDGAGTAGNDSTFDACHDALREGEVVALFPEGTTHDAERLDKIRTGAARIALGARDAGVADLVIVPIGIKFENKVALRSRALARVGQPIDLDAVIAQLVEPGASADDSNHEAVDRLTDLIADRLRQVSPTYRDWEQAASLSLAAEVTLRTKATNYRQEVSLADREDLAQRLAFLDEPTQVEIIDALAAYTFGLDLLGLRDDQVVPGYHAEALTEHVVWSGVRLAALAPATVAGTALNILPYWVVKGASMRVQVPVTKGTVRILASMVAFPLNWIVTAVIVDRRRGRTAAVATLFGAPVFGFAAVYAFERWSNLRHAWKGWQRVSEERSRLGPVLERRAALVALVEKAIGEDLAGDQVPAIDPVEVVEARANEDVFGAAG